MKVFYSILLLVILSSCGTVEVVEETNIGKNTAPVEQTTQDITEALSSLPEGTPQENIQVRPEGRGGSGGPRGGGRGPKEAPVAVYTGGKITDEERAAGKVVDLETTYISPKTEVIMNVSYILDENNTFSKVMVTSPNYTQMPKFNNGIQNVIGMSIEEAAEYHVSGSSLSTVAFKNVLKDL